LTEKSVTNLRKGIFPGNFSEIDKETYSTHYNWVFVDFSGHLNLFHRFTKQSGEEVRFQNFLLNFPNFLEAPSRMFSIS
jgi:hypothetical protein